MAGSAEASGIALLDMLLKTLVDQVDVTTCKEIYSSNKKTCLNEFLVKMSLIKPKKLF